MLLVFEQFSLFFICNIQKPMYSTCTILDISIDVFMQIIIKFLKTLDFFKVMLRVLM